MSGGLIPRNYFDETDSEEETVGGALWTFNQDSDDDEFEPRLKLEQRGGDVAPQPSYKPGVEFQAVSYRERQFAKRMRERISKRGAKPSPTNPALARSAYHDLSLNVTARTTELDLTGQQLSDGSTMSLWTLLGESTVLKRVVLARCGVGPTDGAHIGAALVKNPGSLEVLDLKRCLLDDHGLAGLLDFAPAALLCKGNLRVLDLRGNPMTAASGAALARAAQPPPRLHVEESGHRHRHHHHTLMGSSPLPWSPAPADLLPIAGSAASGARGGDPLTARSQGSADSDDDSDAGDSTRIRPPSPPRWASRFQELSGVPTEDLLRGELAVLNLASRGMGPAEASMVGELLKTAPPAVTRLDLSWNANVMCDGVKALADALRHCSSPLRSLDLTGVRACDVDERGHSVPCFQAAYGGSSRNEPVTVQSCFRSDAVIALCLMLRLGTGAAPTLMSLALNDNCLVSLDLDENRDPDVPRVLEWARPPDAYDRVFVTENQKVLVRVAMPGVGKRLTREWHEGMVLDVRRSRTSMDVGLSWEEENMQKMVMRAAQLQFEKAERRAARTYAALQKHHRRAGTLCPLPPKKLASAERPQPMRPGEEDIKTYQPCAAVAHLAEVLRHGLPPPPTPEEIQQDKVDKAKVALAARIKAEAEARERDADGGPAKSLKQTPPAVAVAVPVVVPDAKAAARAAELAAFKAESEGALDAFLGKQPPAKAEPAEVMAPKPGSIAAMMAASKAAAAAASLARPLTPEDFSDEVEEAVSEGEAEEAIEAAQCKEAAVASAASLEASQRVWGDVPLPAWATGTGGRFGNMLVRLQRLELKRCGLDAAAGAALGRGLEHPSCPISCLFIDGNGLGGGSTMTESLSVNRSLTFISIRQCEFSKAVRREWAGAIIGAAGGRLGAIDCDAFTIVPRPLKSPFFPHGPGGGAPGCIVTGGAAVMAAAAEQGRAKAKGQRRLEAALASVAASSAAAPAAGTAQAHGRPESPGHLSVRSTDVALSDALLLAAALSRNRYVTSVDLGGSNFDSEGASVLVDGLEVRERLHPPNRPRTCDERYDDPTDMWHDDEVQGNSSSQPQGLSVVSALRPSSPSHLKGFALAALSPSGASKRSSFSSVVSAASKASAVSKEFDPRMPVPLPPPPAPFGALLSLGLAGIPLGSVGARAVAEGLNGLRHLRHLSLARCGLTEKGRRVDGAEALVAALDDEQPAPPSEVSTGPRSPKSDGGAKISFAGALGSLVAAGGSSPARPSPQPLIEEVPGEESCGGKRVGRSGAFDSVDVRAAPTGLKVAPPLRFLDLSDNGLSVTLVWRCVVTMRNRIRHMHWIDLSGNMNYDMAPPALAMDPEGWASHNRPPFALGLSLPMRHAVLFGGCQVDWVVESKSVPRPGSKEGHKEGDHRDASPHHLSLAAESSGPAPGSLDMAGLEEKALDHGAPSTFSPTGKDGVAAMVATAEREHPAVAREAKDILREAAWRGQRIKEIGPEIAAAEKHLSKVLERHRAAERAERLKAQAEAEAETLRVSTEKRLAAEAQAAAEAKLRADEEARVAAEENARLERIYAARKKALEVVSEASERALMFGADGDAGFDAASPQAVERRAFFDVVGGRGRDVDADSLPSRPVTPSPMFAPRVNASASGESRVLEGPAQLPKWDLAWEALPEFYLRLGLTLSDEQASQVATVEFGPPDVPLPSPWEVRQGFGVAASGRRPASVGLFDARALLEVARVAVTFFEVDTDGSGEIDAIEVAQALSRLKMGMSPAKCLELLAVIDTDNNGTVDLREFVEFFRHVSFDKRLKAEAEQAQALEGYTVKLDLRRPLGMVVNPNGQVATVKAEGQGEELGVVSGCTFFAAGGAAIASLDDLKAAIDKAKKAMKSGGPSTLALKYKDPKAIARANYRVAECRKDATAAAGAAAAAASDKAEARRKAAALAQVALKEANRLAKIAADEEARARRRAAANAREEALHAVENARAAHEARLKADKDARLAVLKAASDAKEEAEMRAVARASLEALRRQKEEDAAKAVHKLVREREALLLAEEGFKLKSATHPNYAHDHPEALSVHTATKGHRSQPGSRPATPGHRPGSREGGASFVRQRYVISATAGAPKDLAMFTLAFGLVSLFDSQFGGPEHAQAAHKAQLSATLSKSSQFTARQSSRRASTVGAPSLVLELRTMTCELRCLRSWAAAMRKRRKAGAPDLFQALRGVLMDRFRRGDVATWFRQLLVRTQPKPVVRTDHEDGSYLVCDPRLGWIVRLETKSAPCGCDGCQDFSLSFPVGSCHFTLPDVTGDM